MKISVLHPAARPQVLTKIVEAWEQAACWPENVEYIVAFHAEQGEGAGGFKIEELENLRAERSPVEFRFVVNLGFNHPTLNGRSSFVDNINLAAANATGDILVTAADDLIPPDAWDEKIFDALVASCVEANRRVSAENPDQLCSVWPRVYERMLKCSNGDTRSDIRDLVLHPVVTRARYEKQGWMFCPEYTGVYSDNDLTKRARADGVIVEAPEIRFLHKHPAFGTAVEDQVYAWQNSPNEYKLGMQTFRSRALRGFPHKGEEFGPIRYKVL